MAIKVQGSDVITDDKSFVIATGTTAQRPSLPDEGVLFYNTELEAYERYEDGVWSAISSGDTSASSLAQFFFRRPVEGGWELASDVYNGANIALQSKYPELYSRVGADGPNGFSPWITRTSGTLTIINSISYGNGLYIYAGGGGTIGTSTDAINWTVTNNAGGSPLSRRYIAYGNGVYVVGAASGSTVIRSTDGITWQVRTVGTASLNSPMVVFGNGVFVSVLKVTPVGGAQRSAVSTDGVTWTTSTVGTTSGVDALVYGDGQFLIFGDNSMLRSSTDGITWTARSITPTFARGGQPKYLNGRFMVPCRDGIMVSSDGVTFSRNVLNIEGPISYGSGVYIQGTAGVIYTSTDSSKWVNRSQADYNGTSDILFNNNLFISVGSAGSLQTFSFPYDTSTEFLLPNITMPQITFASSADASRINIKLYDKL
jgi:hypothetical protein